MNYYPEFKNYNYTDMNMYNMKSFNKNIYNDQNENSLYDPYNALIRGNLFKNLYPS